MLVIGASGGVGSYAVQLAKALGAAEVTGVASTSKLDLVRSLGADRVSTTPATTSPTAPRYDLVLDIGGNPSLSRLRRAPPTGTAVIVGGEAGGNFSGGMNRQFRGKAWSPFLRQRLTNFVARQRASDLERLAGLLEAGTLTPMIHRRTRWRRPRGDAPPRRRAGRGKVAITV